MPTDDPRKLRDILADQAEAKGLSQAELVKKTGASPSHIEALMNGEIRRLPALPYLRTTLARLAETLGVPPQVLIDKYKSEFVGTHSGPTDQLPGNRFALPSHRRMYVIGAGVAILVIAGYLISRTGFFGRPSLSIATPPADPNPYIVTSSTILLAGRTDPGDSLFVNGQHVAVASDGTFEKEYQLLPEINIIDFSVKRFLGRHVTITRQIYYDTAGLPIPTSTVPLSIPQPTTTTPASSTDGATSTE
jgi:transcriptional regulator with XRE-family HTH domain